MIIVTSTKVINQKSPTIIDIYDITSNLGEGEARTLGLSSKWKTVSHINFEEEGVVELVGVTGTSSKYVDITSIEVPIGTVQAILNILDQDGEEVPAGLKEGYVYLDGFRFSFGPKNKWLTIEEADEANIPEGEKPVLVRTEFKSKLLPQYVVVNTGTTQRIEMRQEIAQEDTLLMRTTINIYLRDLEDKDEHLFEELPAMAGYKGLVKKMQTKSGFEYTDSHGKILPEMLAKDELVGTPIKLLASIVGYKVKKESRVFYRKSGGITYL